MAQDDTVSQIRLWQARQAQLGAAAPVSLLELTRNFGKEAAMLAGLDHVRGECAAAVRLDGRAGVVGFGSLEPGGMKGFGGPLVAVGLPSVR